jgi:hypothetical protein
MPTEEERPEGENQEAEDAAMFGTDDVKTTGAASVEVTRSSSRKLLWVALAVGAIAVVLVTCISVGVVAYVIMSAKPEPTPDDLAKKKDLIPPKEMKARIKNIDRTAGSIKFLVGDGRYQTLSVDSATEFLDEGGKRLPRGFDAPELREEDVVIILTTADRKGLQWVKLTK